jgi:biotin carboxylase
MPKLLIIGAGILQLPAIQKAKEMGLEVAVVDLNPLAPGIPYSDHYFEISTVDEEEIVKAAKNYKPDGVMSLATDMPMRSVAAVAAALNLPSISYEVALKATDKISMIECFRAHGVPHPWFRVFSEFDQLKDELQTLAVPFIMKPSDSSGSRGVILVEDKRNAEDSFFYSKSFSRAGYVLVEEYMQGPEISVETLTINGETSVIAITDKLTSGPPYYVEMGHSQPAQYSSEMLEKIKEVTVFAVESIGIDNSPAHVEMIITENGPKLVELGARLGGDCITSHLVPLSTGVDMIKACVELSLGLVPDIRQHYNKGAAIRYLDSKEGLFNGIRGIEMAEKEAGIRKIEIVKNIGDRIGEIHGSGDRVGYIIAQSDTAQGAISVCNECLKMLDVIVI